MRVTEIPGPIGPLDALLEPPHLHRGIGPDGIVHAGHSDRVRAAVVLGHPHPEYGGTMHTKAVYRAAKALSRIGCAVLRFNFRSAGNRRGAFTNGPGEMDDFRAGLDFMQQRYPATPLWAGGMSFGAWVALTVGAADDRVSTLIGIAPPLNRYDFTTVRESTKPKFFVQGERDELCPLQDMQKFYAQCAEPKELVVIDAADHLFDGKVSEVADALEDLLGDWDPHSTSQDL